MGIDSPGKKTRNITVDVIKCFAIILVLLGHSIQYGPGTDSSGIADAVYRFIYSFHMPLFIMISGWLFAFSAKSRTWTDCIKTRAKRLLVPTVIWNLITAAITLLSFEKSELTLFGTVKTVIWCVLNNLWFLWAVFWCSLIVIITKRFLKDSIVVYLLIFAVSFAAPDAFMLEMYKFAFPFFIVGYIFNSRNMYVRFKKICDSRLAPAAFGVVFFVMLYFYRSDMLIYASGHSVLNKDLIQQLYIDFFRLFIGLTGSAFVILIISKITSFVLKNKNKAALAIGKNTMGIYIVSDFIFKYLFVYLHNLFNSDLFYTALAETVIVLIVSFAVVKLIQLSKTARTLLLGG